MLGGGCSALQCMSPESCAIPVTPRTPGSCPGLHLSCDRGLYAALPPQPGRQIVGKLMEKGDRAVPVTAWLGTDGAVAVLASPPMTLTEAVNAKDTPSAHSLLAAHSQLSFSS